MTAQDLDRVHVLADAIHPNHLEGEDVFTERQRLYPEGCHALAVEGWLVGYAVTHPWQSGEPPPLNSRLGALPHEATTYYIHDVALLPEARGNGYAAQIVERLADYARGAGFGDLSLVAVNRSQMFWGRLGFRAMAVPGLDRKLRSYGSDAVLMTRDLTKARF